MDNTVNGRRHAVTVFLISLNILIFFICELRGGSGNHTVMRQMGAMVIPCDFSASSCLRLFTSLFLHFGFTHLMSNMVSLYVMGSFLEERTGHLRFLVLYLAGGIAGNLVSWYWYTATGETVISAGASGAISSLLGATAAMTLLRKKEMRGISLPRLLIAVLLVMIPRSDASIDLAAHIGGLAAGMILTPLTYLPKPFSRY